MLDRLLDGLRASGFDLAADDESIDQRLTTLAAFYGDMPAAFALGAPVRVINTAALEHPRQRARS